MHAVTFGENLRRLRIRSGMTQEDLGRVMEKSKNNISQYETGKREPDLATLLRLAELFRVTTDELLGRPAIFRNVRVYDRYTLTDRGSPAQWRPVPCRELTEDEFIFYRMGDHSMNSMRIRKGDTLLIRLEKTPRSSLPALLLLDGEPCVRMPLVQSDGRILLITGDLNAQPRLITRDKLDMIGTVVRVEFTPASDVR